MRRIIDHQPIRRSCAYVFGVAAALLLNACATQPSNHQIQQIQHAVSARSNATCADYLSWSDGDRTSQATNVLNAARSGFMQTAAPDSLASRFAHRLATVCERYPHKRLNNVGFRLFLQDRSEFG